jgi:hypothetical protein
MNVAGVRYLDNIFTLVVVNKWAGVRSTDFDTSVLTELLMWTGFSMGWRGVFFYNLPGEAKAEER